MNVEIGAEAALFPEKEYINGIAVAVFVLFFIKQGFPIPYVIQQCNHSEHYNCYYEPLAEKTPLTERRNAFKVLVGQGTVLRR